MTDEIPPDAPELDDEHVEFTGTLFFVMVFIILTAGMWAAVYFMLLGR